MKGKIFLLAFIVLGFSAFIMGQTAEELISQADSIYEEMTTMEQAQEARQLYQKATGIADNKYEAFWKLARIQYYIGAHTESNNDKKTIFSQAVYYTNKAVELEPEKPDAYYWRGVNNGKYGEAKGVLKSLSLVKPIKKDMNKVLELNASYEDGGADRVLGRVFFKVPGIAGGSKKKSREHLLKSKELGPDDAMTRVYLGETLLSLKDVEGARAELEYVMNMEDDPRWQLAIAECKEMAAELLKDKKFRK